MRVSLAGAAALLALVGAASGASLRGGVEETSRSPRLYYLTTAEPDEKGKALQPVAAAVADVTQAPVGPNPVGKGPSGEALNGVHHPRGAPPMPSVGVGRSGTAPSQGVEPTGPAAVEEDAKQVFDPNLVANGPSGEDLDGGSGPRGPPLMPSRPRGPPPMPSTGVGRSSDGQTVDEWMEAAEAAVTGGLVEVGGNKQTARNGPPGLGGNNWNGNNGPPGPVGNNGGNNGGNNWQGRGWR